MKRPVHEILDGDERVSGDGSWVRHARMMEDYASYLEGLLVEWANWYTKRNEPPGMCDPRMGAECDCLSCATLKAVEE